MFQLSHRLAGLAVSTWIALCSPALSENIRGQVLGGGRAIVSSTVSLWRAGQAAPTVLARARTSADGSFSLQMRGKPGPQDVLYIVAQGGQVAGPGQAPENSAIALISVVGSAPPNNVVANEMTTVASVWTHAQFLRGTEIKGHALGLRIASGNVPNFVDLKTGGWGDTIQDPLNGAQTPTMANFATLADLLAGCVTRVREDACTSLFAASTGPDGAVPGSA